jgi:hypothetical protein
MKTTRMMVVIAVLWTWASAQADIVVTANTNANQLANAITAGGGAGINVTATTLSGHATNIDTFVYIDGLPVPTNVVAYSSGLYSLTGPIPDTYHLATNGIVLSTGNVSDYATGTNNESGRSGDFVSEATPEQNALLQTISGISNHFDVTQLDLVFNVQPGTSNVSFRVVWGTEEYPQYIGSDFVDAFGIFLNGSNIAYASNQPIAPGTAPINVNHTNMAAITGTELNGVLAPNGNPVLKFTAPVVPSSTSNTLTFIIADSGDGILDATVYIAGFGGSAESPPVCSLTPPLDTNVVGQTHTVIATVTTNGVPVAGLNVSFSVSGAHAIAATNVVTASNGQASFSYLGTNVGTDTILAAGGLGQSEFSCDASKVWVASGTQPQITCPGNIVTNTAAFVCDRIVTFNVGATGTPTPTVVCSPPSGATFPKGVLTVNCTASNSAGTAQCTFTVTVNDTEPPSLLCPGNITTNVAAGVTNAVVSFTLGDADDNCPGGSLTVIPPSGSTFPLGSNTVNATMVDASGNTNTCSFKIIVTTAAPNQPPVAFCKPFVIVEAGTLCAAAVLPTTVDDDSSDPDGFIVSRSLSPAGPYSKGTNSVVLTVVDNTGASNSCNSTIYVVDTTPPAWDCPGNIVTNVPAGVTNAVVLYGGGASDVCGIASIPCDPPLGHLFPLGTNPVVCVATDTSGNSSTCSFDVVVNQLPPETHDLALIKMKAPKNINLKGAEASLTKFVKVTLQNRSPHNEVITNFTGLVTLVAESLGEICSNAQVVLRPGPPNNPKTLKPKQKMTVTFDVTWTCANDPLKGAGHEDFRYLAAVHHEAIDGNADTHPEDDGCPRAALPAGQDMAFKDTGCAGGVDVKTDVLVKP